uniref:Uncharacterized protein n=1 Tax=Arundo donax TaxID=35708 RepID=A0A0A8ZV29_ARUDO
MLRPVYQHTCR